MALQAYLKQTNKQTNKQRKSQSNLIPKGNLKKINKQSPEFVKKEIIKIRVEIK